MTPVYCLPIIRSSKAEVLSTIAKHRDRYQYFEVWLDYISDIDLTFVQTLINQFGDELVLVLRRQELEPIQMALSQRLAVIDELAGSPVLLDLDISQTRELSHLKLLQQPVQLLASYHNYQETPGDAELQKILEAMAKFKPAIYKLATLCQSANDALRLLMLLSELKSVGKHAILLGMGESGQITRIFGAFLGNELTFAPARAEEASAPGQLTRKQLETIFKELGYGHAR
jgi:3-dehydroquinate dehydratase type I